MQVYHGIEEFRRLPNAVVTSGTFDGVHLGHQKILNRLIESARQSNGESVVITFWPHPRIVVSADSADLKLLNTLDEKIEYLQASGIDHLLVIPFNRDFSLLTSDEFIRKILIDTIGTKRLVIGYDHRFGRNREGGFDYLQAHSHEYGFEVEEIPRQDVEHLAVSSTRIRQSLLTGDVTTAAAFLGRSYTLSGTVVKGRQLGRQLGYPTANLELPESYKLVPADGVYAVRVKWKSNWYGGMLSIGTNPTVDGTIRTIEVNIFDFDKEIYGEKLTLEFVIWLRGQIKYNGLEPLIAQIGQDKIDSLKFL
ncbi:MULTISPECIES: bifunctional riboflavin kinase/FAD synthetase [unclassified Siphonobacter]|uniref:bifunctional riboflavin kinase/FAD synthetase n=1 Tax=unclassified Siphonobacter TaxID=2635712 RepID=UPI002780C0BF|nr:MULTISPECIES: bifunctional riboflavin kinase/FAD synthetase [unclassified Siphonobacter]MDQ1088746.1 riboflavin kinase/FMN adenylyltransferase [Siphonobacter sp. SORGH_AS_1065]MDR6194891.1 riboflavin kinase/FMN adenylyltransferase [Siphonobacter sp. SORGH_AS_0500]